MHHTISATINDTHTDLERRFAAAVRSMDAKTDGREIRHQVDRFLVPVSGHVSAFAETVLPIVRARVDGGREAAAEYLRQCRRLEYRLLLAKRRMYGEIHSHDTPWPEVWRSLTAEFDKTLTLERQLLVDVLPHLDEHQREVVGDRLASAELHAPTRPHPHVPHLGPWAVTRRFYARADRVWDFLEGRIDTRET